MMCKSFDDTLKRLSEIEQAFEHAMDRMQAEMPDAPPWREIAEERPEEVQIFRRFIDHFAEEFSRSQSERVSRLEEAAELLKDAQYHLRADIWAEQFNGRVKAFLTALNQGADDVR